MRVIIFPTQDTTIYSEFPDLNTGLDEILEVGKSDTSISNQSKRALLKFDLTDIVAQIQAGTIPSSSQFELKLYLALAENIDSSQVLNVCRVAEDWTEGTGRFYEQEINDTRGATWNQRRLAASWSGGSTGNSLLTGSIAVNLTRPVSDLTVDVTAWVNTWIVSGSNNGFCIKSPDSDEADPLTTGEVRFFSKDTHTIYRPTLTAKWNDQTLITGSLMAAPTSGLYVVPQNLKMTYAVGEIVRADLLARAAYPLKTIETMFTNYVGNRYLPSTSYFSITDELTGNVIVPFDDYSRVSCDGTNSYIKFRIENMYPLRYYRLKIKVDHDGLSEIFDSNHIFRVKS
jgi:hypothetical protein